MTIIDELRLFTPWLTHFETLQYLEPGTSSLTQADYQAQMPQAFEPWYHLVEVFRTVVMVGN